MTVTIATGGPAGGRITNTQIKTSCFSKAKSLCHEILITHGHWKLWAESLAPTAVTAMLCLKCEPCTHSDTCPTSYTGRSLHTLTVLSFYTFRCGLPYPTSLIMHMMNAPCLRFGSRWCCSLVLLFIGCSRVKRQRLDSSSLLWCSSKNITVYFFCFYFLLTQSWWLCEFETIL